MKNHNLESYFPMRSNAKNIFFALAILFSVGCSTALYIPTQENILPNANLGELQKGRQLYINNCGSCHTLYLPEKYNVEQWRAWIKKMEPKVKITNEENSLIFKYVTKGQK